MAYIGALCDYSRKPPGVTPIIWICFELSENNSAMPSTAASTRTCKIEQEGKRSIDGIAFEQSRPIN